MGACASRENQEDLSNAPENVPDKKEAIDSSAPCIVSEEDEDSEEEDEEIDFDDLFEKENDMLEEDDDNVEFMAIKPWLGSIFEPDVAPAQNPAEPDECMSIDWIYGYRCHDSRNNIALSSDGSIIYPQAAVVVNYDPKEHTQDYLLGHTDDVLCLAQSPADPNVIVTGQVASCEEGSGTRRSSPPFIQVWNLESMESTCIIRNAAKRCVRQVSINLAGDKICCIGGDNNFTVYIYDIESGALLDSVRSGNNKIFACTYSKQDNNTWFIAGSKSVQYCTYENGSLTVKRFLFGKHMDQSRETHLCACSTDKGTLITGTNKGNVCIFQSNCKSVIKCSKKPIYTVCMAVNEDEETVYLIGGADGQLQLRSKKFKLIESFAIGEKIRSLVYRDGNVVVGTMKSNIYTADISSLNDLEGPHIQGHFDGELWGICSNPNNDEFVTVGEDNTIRVWDKTLHKCINEAVLNEKRGKKKKRRRVGTTSSLPPNQCSRAVAINPQNGDIVFGLNNGYLKVFDASLIEKQSINLNKYAKGANKKQSSSWIECVSFSPQSDGKQLLAVGTHGMAIVVLECGDDNYRVAWNSKAHNAPITNLDWSSCGKHLQTVCMAYELLFFNIDTENIKSSCQNTSPSRLTHVMWHTQTCKFGWCVQGVFNGGIDGSQINSCAKDNDENFIFAATDLGTINVFRYPCLEGSACISANGHSSHVPRIIIGNTEGGDICALSTGGNDKAIIQWTLA